MNTPVVWKLKVPMTFIRPHYWSVQLRYAVLTGGEKVPLQPGTWLLELKPNQVTPTSGQKAEIEEYKEYLYRLASGETVALDHALTPAEAKRERNPQAITAMTAFRTIDQAVFEDWGVQVDHIDSTPPFSILKCPMCNTSGNFVSIDFASVWCGSCNTSFTVTHTAGDPGFVIQAQIRHTWPGSARYLMPQSEKLTLHMVYKNGGDPRQKPAGTKPPNGYPYSVTDESHPVLRAGLYTYQIGDLYPWKLGGLAPTLQDLYEVSGNGYTWKIGGKWWPLSAHVPTSGLSSHHQAVLTSHLRTLQERENPEEEWGELLLEALADLTQRLPLRKVGVYFSGEGLPPLADVTENQRYLLYEWLVCTVGDTHPVTSAYPVWYVVEPILSQESGRQYIEGWDVIRRDICPVCCRRVTAEEMTFHAEAAHRPLSLQVDRDWYLPHTSCREVWAKGKWFLYEQVREAIKELQPKPAELTDHYWLVLPASTKDEADDPEDAPKEIASLFAVISLDTEMVTRLFWWSQVAQGNKQGIPCSANYNLRLFAALGAPPVGNDCFTGQTLAEQGFVVVNADPTISKEGQPVVTEIKDVQCPWAEYDPDGNIHWSVQVQVVSSAEGRAKNLEIARFSPEALRRLAELVGVTQDWAEKHRLAVEVMTQKVDPGRKKKKSNRLL